MATRKEGELVLGIALALTYCPRIKNDVLKCAVLQNEAAGRALLKAHEAIHEAIDHLTAMTESESEQGDAAFESGQGEMDAVRKAFETLITEAQEAGW